MTSASRTALYGWSEIEPEDEVVAGSIGTWRLTYHTGLYGVDDGGTRKRALDLEYVETDLPKISTPYYVRLIQVDGAKAWSSPIWISMR